MSGSEDSRTGATSVDQYLIKDPERFAMSIAKMIEQAGRAASAWARPRENGQALPSDNEPLAEMVRTLSRLSEYWMSDSSRALEAQTRLFAGYMSVWQAAAQRAGGGQAVESPVKPDPRDKRFQDPEWANNAFFDFLKQAYLVTSRWAGELVDNAEGLDDHTRHKARFFVNQVAAAISPSNFVMTNPELLRETVAAGGENLVRGMAMLADDIEAGHGHLKLRQSDSSRFSVGGNIATTPGKVVAKNDLVEIIQYQATTAKVLKRPLLICPPWINKFYILDLNPEKSFVKWAVAEGHTVFVISWVNPDATRSMKGWLEYIREGLQFALDTIENRTGETSVNAVGYCVGGTLLASALALFSREKEDRIKTATFLATQVDFRHAGDLKVFVDEEQVCMIERMMQPRGYFEGSQMAMAFNMLRAGDLIWPYIVNNYVRGKTPMPFDLLYWNSDSTRMTAANQSFYLRNFYLENRLSRGELQLGGHDVRLSDVKIPVYSVATRDDHISPARSVYLGAQYFGGDVTFVLSGSGHIAGIVNPPAANKYQHWTGERPIGSLEDWLEGATEHSGSWWNAWQRWIESHSDQRVTARRFNADDARRVDAPGEYVRVVA